MSDETTVAYVATSQATKELRDQLQKLQDKFDPYLSKKIFRDMWSCFGQVETKQLALFAAALRELNPDG